jgi:alanine dehydrogenase
MRIGVPKEIKVHEYRVGLVPAAVRELVESGHAVVVQTGAAAGIGFADADYERVGATIAATAEDVFAQSEMIVKVKEPQPQECARLQKGQILYTYLHLAPDPRQTEALVKSGATCMLGGVPGVAPAKVVILGGGVSGTHAAEMAVGLRADVTVLDRSMKRLRELSTIFGPSLRTEYSTQEHIDALVIDADLVIGAVLIAGAAAPRLVTRDMVRRMKPGSVLVDISIDQGGCFETSKATTHAEPTYVVDDVIHYCVANMPGAVPRTSTFALNNATLPFARRLADQGWKAAMQADPHLANGLNVHEGHVTNEAVAHALGLPYTPVARFLK